MPVESFTKLFSETHCPKFSKLEKNSPQAVALGIWEGNYYQKAIYDEFYKNYDKQFL